MSSDGWRIRCGGHLGFKQAETKLVKLFVKK